MRHTVYSFYRTYKPRLDPCKTNNGLPKFTHRTIESAWLQSKKHSRTVEPYWCENHQGWHIGNKPRPPGFKIRNVTDEIELGERVASHWNAKYDRYSDPDQLRKVFLRRGR